MLVLNAVFSVEDAVYQRSSDVEDIWDFTSRIGCRSPQKRVPWPCGDFVLWMCQLSVLQGFHEMRSWPTWRVERKLPHLKSRIMTDESPHSPAFVWHEHLGCFMEHFPSVCPRLQSWLPECGGILAPKLVAKKIQRVANPGRRYYHLRWQGHESYMSYMCFFLSSVNWNNMNMIWSLTTTIASLHHPSDVSETKIHNFPVNKAAGSPWKCRKLGGLKVTLQHFFWEVCADPETFTWQISVI